MEVCFSQAVLLVYQRIVFDQDCNHNHLFTKKKSQILAFHLERQQMVSFSRVFVPGTFLLVAVILGTDTCAQDSKLVREASFTVPTKQLPKTSYPHYDSLRRKSWYTRKRNITKKPKSQCFKLDCKWIVIIILCCVSHTMLYVLFMYLLIYGNNYGLVYDGQQLEN